MQLVSPPFFESKDRGLVREAVDSRVLLTDAHHGISVERSVVQLMLMIPLPGHGDWHADIKGGIASAIQPLFPDAIELFPS